MVVKVQFQEYAETNMPTTQNIGGPSSFAYDNMIKLCDKMQL